MEKGEEPGFSSPNPSKMYNRISVSAESSPRSFRRGTGMTWQYSDVDSPENKRERHQRLNVGMMISPPLSTSSSSLSGSDQSHSSDDFDGRIEVRLGSGGWGQSLASQVASGMYGKKSTAALSAQEGSGTVQILPSVTHVALEYGIPDLKYSVSIGGLYKVGGGLLRLVIAFTPSGLIWKGVDPNCSTFNFAFLCNRSKVSVALMVAKGRCFSNARHVHQVKRVAYCEEVMSSSLAVRTHR